MYKFISIRYKSNWFAGAELLWAFARWAVRSCYYCQKYDLSHGLNMARQMQGDADLRETWHTLDSSLPATTVSVQSLCWLELLADFFMHVEIGTIEKVIAKPSIASHRGSDDGYGEDVSWWWELQQTHLELEGVREAQGPSVRPQRQPPLDVQPRIRHLDNLTIIYKFECQTPTVAAFSIDTALPWSIM